MAAALPKTEAWNETGWVPVHIAHLAFDFGVSEYSTSLRSRSGKGLVSGEALESFQLLAHVTEQRDTLHSLLEAAPSLAGVVNRD
jgi:hypothetical protein